MAASTEQAPSPFEARFARTSGSRLPMNVHYIYCHPLPESFHAAIRTQALAGLKEAGHKVDLCDLYAEKFDPVMSQQERRDYHDLTRNQSQVADYVRRLRAADALICQFPVW